MTTNEFDSIEKIARDFVTDLCFDDRKYLRDGGDGFGEVCRAIRNEYGLWTDNPLTENWRNHPETRVLDGGFDYSEDHPDNLSEKIRLRVVEILKEEK
jgi:hypothetical protein